ncbi:UVB-resistance protein UVR8 [Cryptosporidium ubiquitum]|uniref:UVB-resistance protein UVR8 n=1 Tax=Cryptosporidium ubiquitum TaxID=857276 RepID=A0A1J4MI93_9CRYT|nr:UVB-resistance protein UVR8 [Cryptosporidium ubiquitum]OII73171.1 UVB-resistance protein UVR8 [Cryptosporidium ubiquitum]
MGQNVSKSGVVVWGSTEYGQHGSKTEEVNPGPHLVEGLRHLNSISKVSCGSNYSAAITNSGDLIVWGYGGCGQLGFGTLEDCLVPRVNLNLKHVVQISCSDRHTAAILSTGELYTWGCSKNGKLGHGQFELSISNNVVSQPMKVKALEGEKIIQVSCGSYHTGCLTGDKKALTWGLGLQGRLGHGDTQDIFTPKLIESLAGLPIKEISCGGHHTAILLSTGKLYMFGGGAFGKLGFGSKDDVLIPKLLEGPLEDIEIIKVSLGSQHSAVVTNCGEVYTWGQGGRLGHIFNGPEHDFLSPKKLSSLEKAFIVDISCGNSHTAALSDVGDIYTWGMTKNLGHGIQGVHPNMPSKHPVLQNKNIVQVVCSSSHSIALSDIGALVQKTSDNWRPKSLSEDQEPKKACKPIEEFKTGLSSLARKKIWQEIKEKLKIGDDKEKIDYLMSELEKSEEQNAVLVSLLDVSVRKLEAFRKENEELRSKLELTKSPN